MPAPTPVLTDTITAQLQTLGGQIRAHRKALGISATAAAEAAGLSRVTLHRIEKGEPSVTLGAYASTMAALGLALGVAAPDNTAAPDTTQDRKGWIPARIRLADYPQLQSLAWQVHGTGTLSPAEALGIYERNARHVDAQAMAPHEQDLLVALKLAFGEGAHGV
jgi:transcriptional regulator with XRE-family HTH domain